MPATDRVVLIGEPDQATAELYRRALRVAFEVLAAHDETTLLRTLSARRIAALVLEPAIFGRGWTDIVAISRECAARGIPLVICSTLDERRRGMELGATIYLVKPTLPSILLDTLQNVIGSGGA
ncbi:MAG: hypothetical protein IPO81_28415 [Kouleothrix sp.]|nr:hypothetical protein [Kouleothrix sp.]